MPPNQGLADKKTPSIKGSKVRLTYALTSNAVGSEKLQPIIIGKAHKPHMFRNRTGTQLKFHYQNNAKAWMTSSLYQEWLQQWNRELCAEIARSFFCKIIFQVTLFQMVFKIFTSRTLHQTSLHMSSQWTRASSGVSRLTIVQSSFRVPSITTTKV